jgi:hypothetical protein
MYTEAIQSISTGWLPVFEFAAITFVCTLTYLGVHSAFFSVKPAMKAVLSMFLGVTAYSLAKFVLVIFLVKPVLNAF